MAKDSIKGFENAKSFESGAKNAPAKSNEQQNGRFADVNGNFYASKEVYDSLMAKRMREGASRH